MKVTRRLLVGVLTGVLSAAVLVGCASQEPSAVEPATEEIETQVEETQATIDETLNAAQEAVGNLAAAVGGLEARVDGLQISSDLQEIQRKLNSAIEEVGDKKIAALEEISAAFDNVIGKVDAAAAKLPEGGPVRTELEGFSQQLKTTQASLVDAAAAYEASATPAP